MTGGSDGGPYTHAVAEDRGRTNGSALFSPVVPGRISELIVDQIRELILDGTLPPGERLPSERELVERFRVSRVTVRDALRMLEAQGLLEIRVGASGGAFVTAPSAAVVGEGIATMLLMSAIGPEDIAEARLLMELGIVTLAVNRATPDDIAVLREICERSEAALTDDRYDVSMSAEFHAALAAAAHNGAVELMTESFRGPLSMASARAREEPDEAHSHSVSEHIDLVNAVEARDLQRAQTVMTDHLLRATSVEWNTVEALRGVFGHA